MHPHLAERPFLKLSVLVGPPVTIGAVGGVERRCVPLLGGSVAGDYQGEILPGGTDWQTIDPDGMLDIAARYVLSIDGALVEVQSNGLRSGAPDVLARLAQGEILPASSYYFRTAMRFFTQAPQLSRFNTLLAIAVGERLPDSVNLSVYEVL